MNSVAELQLRLGQHLRRLRLARGWSVADLAAHASLAEKSVRNLETGRGSTIDTLLRVLTSLGVTQALDALIPDTSNASEFPNRQRAPRK